MVATPDGGPNGALVEAETASLTLGVVVPDLEGALRAAEAEGGAVAMPVLDNGWVRKAQIRDPAGNLLTLIQG
jgi:predicted enzyme related to lactoylglutathione lyase